MCIAHNDRRAAIVCSHVAKEAYPILRAIRTEPLEPEDSGWQFLCNSGRAEVEAEAQVWLVEEVLGIEGSLSTLINCEVGTEISRESKGSAWVIKPHSLHQDE